MIILISGVSGVGKNTVINRLLEVRANLRYFRSCTTREKRASEEVFSPYIFLSEKEFLEKEKNGEFFEVQQVHGTYRGILKSSLDEVLANPQLEYIKDIDVFGNLRIKNFMKDKGECLSIFLDAPDETILQRLLGRGESEESAAFRLSRSKLEREHLGEYDAVIENDDLEKTVLKINGLIDAAKKKK